jgi:hypothetical protein
MREQAIGQRTQEKQLETIRKDMNYNNNKRKTKYTRRDNKHKILVHIRTSFYLKFYFYL